MEIVTGLLLVLFVTVIARLVLRVSQSEPPSKGVDYWVTVVTPNAFTLSSTPPQDARQVLVRQSSKPISFQRAPRYITTNPYAVTYPNRDIPEVVSPFAARALGIGSPDDR
jgi:hypothetical protein